MSVPSPTVLVVLASSSGSTAIPLAGRMPSAWLLDACDRSRMLSTAPTMISDVLATPRETVLQALSQRGGDPALVVYLDLDQPLTSAADLDGALALAIEQHADLVIAGLAVRDRAWTRAGTPADVSWVDSGAFYVWRTEPLRANSDAGAVRFWSLPARQSGRAEEPGDRARCETLLRQRTHDDRLQRLPSTISALVLDFDGVFTDNQVFVFQDGREAVSCNRSDAFGLAECRELGIPMIVLSTEANPVVKARCEKLRLPFIQGLADKGAQLELWLAEQRFDRANIVYIGNDINDLDCMRLVGCAVAPADAHPRAMEHASIVLESRGGHGAVREICSLVAARVRR